MTQSEMHAMRLLSRTFKNLVAQVYVGGRRIDALGFKPLFGSRNLSDLHGFEIKASRADWSAERGQPDKSAAGFEMCAYWWVVAMQPGIVRPAELPEGWGLLIFDGTDLFERTRAAKRPRAVPPTWELVEALVLAAGRRQWAAVHAAYERGLRDGRSGQAPRPSSPPPFQKCFRKPPGARLSALRGLERLAALCDGYIQKDVCDVCGLPPESDGAPSDTPLPAPPLPV